MTFIQTSEYIHLESIFNGDLVHAAHPNYQESCNRWSVLAEKPAGLVAFAKDSEDVSAAVKFAVEAGLEIAIKGGGHNPSGASSTKGGLVIDLSRYLNHVRVDQQAKIAHVGGGALWSDVDNATCPFGLATVGGTVSETGVGGLTVGGGYGFLTGRHGLTIDNLIGATVVIADGWILQTNKDENHDLFFAIRGGGSNFGIVTNFQFALHPIPPVCWSGGLFFTVDKVDKLVQAGARWKKEVMTVDDMILMGLTQSPKDGSQVIILTCIHLGPGEVGKKQCQLFYDVGPFMDMTTEKPYLEVNQQLNHAVPRGKAYYSTGATVTNITSNVLQNILKIQAEFKIQIPQVKSMVGFEIYNTNKILEVSNDTMAFACRGPQSNVIINVSWVVDDMDKVDVGEVRKKVKEIIGAVQGDQVKVEPSYGNYDGGEVISDEKVRKLFGANYRKLQTIKAKYDPNLVFGKWFPIQPLA